MIATHPKILFLGVGKHCSRSHIAPLNKLGANVWGFFDPNQGNINKAIAEHALEDVRIFNSDDEGMAEADAVVIASPDRFHLSQMIKAIGNGCHVFCEKPLAASVDEVHMLKVLFEAAAKVGLTITTCHPRRMDPQYIHVKQHLENFCNLMGRVVEVHLDFSYHIPSKTGLHGGSLLQDHANHEIDYFCWLMGIKAFTAYKLYDEEDRYALSGVNEDGVVFHFGGTRRLEESIYAETIRIRFDSGEVLIDTERPDNSYFQYRNDGERISISRMPKADHDKKFMDLNYHWLQVMAGEADNYVSTEQMLLNTAMSVSFQDNHTFRYKPLQSL